MGRRFLTAILALLCCSFARLGAAAPARRGLAPGSTRISTRPPALRPVVVRRAAPEPVSFSNQVLPVLSKAGCNSGTCHGNASGRNGFKLSVFAFDPEADFHAVAREAGGRRLNVVEPERSLLLLKATAAMPHGGGRRFAAGSPQYGVIFRWLRAGARFSSGTGRTLTAIDVYPRERVLRPRSTQQLRVTARYSDGSRRDVTRDAIYHANDKSLTTVDGEGLVRTTSFPGEASVAIRYLDQVSIARIVVPLNRPVPAAAYSRLPRLNYLDELVDRKLRQLQVLPSPQAPDAEFLRRAYLDVIGTLPSVEETRVFLADRSPGKRSKLVDSLLSRPEYADYWASRWADLLRVNRGMLGAKAALTFDTWLRDQFRQNVAYDQFVRDLILAQGDSARDGPVNFYRTAATPGAAAAAVSQLFLGVRLECAQCHHHPYERWSREDFYGLAAFFAGVRRRPTSQGSEFVSAGTPIEILHPRTGAVVAPKPLIGTRPPDLPGDLRQGLVEWMVSPGNPYFARAIANRMASHLLGRGLVEPVDDLRETNPAVNEALLEALARDLTLHRYDLKHLIRVVMNSRVYQTSSLANATNSRDNRNYSRAYRKRLPAEVLLDAVSQVCGVTEVFEGQPAGTRAIQLWDSQSPSYFLSVFGRPARSSGCECERLQDTTLTQVLHLMNSPDTQARVASEDGRIARLIRSGASEDAMTTELYLAAFSRPPTAEERRTARSAFRTGPSRGADRRSVAEDLLWALLNSPEFIFNH